MVLFFGRRYLWSVFVGIFSWRACVSVCLVFVCMSVCCVAVWLRLCVVGFVVWCVCCRFREAPLV